MNVNLTLGVQIFNFLVAYWFLAKFLFKPALSVLNDGLLEKVDLENAISQEEELLLQKQHLKKQELLKVHNYFKNSKPEVALSGVFSVPGESGIEKFSGITDEQRKELVGQIVSTIQLKVVDG